MMLEQIDKKIQPYLGEGMYLEKSFSERYLIVTSASIQPLNTQAFNQINVQKHVSRTCEDRSILFCETA